MSPTPERTLLAIEDLKVRFAGPQGATQVVRGVDLSLEAGEVLALVGESGSGKSVTSLAVMGLLGPSAEVQGHVRFQDRSGVVQDLTRMSAKGRAGLRGAQMAMIFQEPMTALNPVLSVGAQIGEVMRLHEGLRGGPLRRRVIELLRSVDIADPDRRADAYPHELSGGMRQRVMIAMALACRPSLLIADEPTTALDVTVQMQILDLLRRAQSDLGMGVLFITHNLALVAAIADRVAVMYAGRVVETAPVRTLFSRPRHPYTQGLLASLPERRGVGPKRRLRAISGSPPDPREPEVGCAFAPRCPLAVEPCRRQPPSLEPVATVGASRCLRWREL